MNDKIKPRSLTFFLVMVVLLVFTSIMPVTAVNKDPENLGLGAPVQAGDVIICSTPIKVTYYDSYGTVSYTHLPLCKPRRQQNIYHHAT